MSDDEIEWAGPTPVTHYSLQLANGRPLDSILDEVWLQGFDAPFPDGTRTSPYAPSAGVK